MTNRQLAWRSIGIKRLTNDQVVRQEQQATINTEIGIALAGGLIGWVLWTAAILPFTPLKGTLLGNLVLPTITSIVVSTAIWLVSLNAIRRSKFHIISSIHLEQGHCAACAYKLEGLTPEPDGCITCPECSAAWKHDRIGAAGMPEPDP